MKRAVWITLLISACWATATVSRAQTNSYIATTDGFWDEARLWSLATPPSISQSGIFITNAVNVNVTIDSITASEFPDTLTISNLTVYPPQTNSLVVLLDNTGSVALHVLDGLTVGGFDGGTATLMTKDSTLVVDAVSGGQLNDNGTIIISGGSLVATNCSLVLGETQGGNLTITNGGLVEAQGVAVGDNDDSTVQVDDGILTVNSSLNLGVGGSSDTGTLIIQDGGFVIITNGNITVGADTYGELSISNGTLLGSTMNVGSSFRYFGSASIEDGTVTLGGSLNIGNFAPGEVDLTRGALTVTNGDTIVGGEMGYAFLTMNDGAFLARSVLIADNDEASGRLTINGGITQLSLNLQLGDGGLSMAYLFINGGELFVTNGSVIASSLAGLDAANIQVSGGFLAANNIILGNDAFQGEGGGTLSINGGSMTVTTGIRLGDCRNPDFGYLAIGGGQVIVTNAAHTGFVDVQDGQLVLTNGTLQVDTLVMTNSCSQFIHTGGTLIVGSVILDPNGFRIVSVTPQSNDVLVSWLMAPGATNALQASNGTINGSYATNTFTDIFIVTNFLDLGAATNKSRFYRARLSL